MSNNRTYNGWTNYETWNVKLWLDNDPGSQAWAEEIVTTDYDAARPWEAAESLKTAVTDTMPDLGASVWADLLGAALEEVNWQEITDAYAEDLGLDTAEDED